MANDITFSRGWSVAGYKNGNILLDMYIKVDTNVP